MHNELFSDGIGEVTINGSVVRIDLVSASPTERDGTNKPKRVFRQRIIMPVEAFANSVELLERVLKTLADSGTIMRTPQSNAASVKMVAADNDIVHIGRDASDRPSNGSPNFN